MANPVLIEVTRGDLVESCHRGAIAVVDADAREVMGLGDIDAPIYPRSAVKVIQALPLVESGAADALGFGEQELAMACSSHVAEPAHVEMIRSMLARAGLTHEALECGTHWPSIGHAARALASSGETPTALHNNCSGKHAGFLCTSVHLGIDPKGYVRRDHPVQHQVTAALEQVIGTAHTVEHCAPDGCSIPTHAVPLKNLALGFARMATGKDLSQQRADAARRLFQACFNQPFFVEGTRRPCSLMLEAGAGDVFAKNGAEGVYCGAIPSLGLGIALKCDDGNMRAAAPAFAAVVARLLERGGEVQSRFAELATKPLKNHNGWTIGEIHPSGELSLNS
ncbi:MAG: asparaginase [Rhizobiaceae bacterium]